jgi:hypothetical protein
MWKKMKISNQNKLLAGSFFVFIAFSMLYSWMKPKEKIQTPEKIYADTFIPKGFVLVPVELANFDSVSALIDQFGVIDLYAGVPQAAGSIKIASRIKILRAPLNSQLFAVLVAEKESSLIMKNPGPFWAVVQNRQSVQEKTNEAAKSSVQIEYNKGG